LLVHRRLREAARNRIALSESDEEICASDTQEFLPYIELIALLGSECTRG